MRDNRHRFSEWAWSPVGIMSIIGGLFILATLLQPSLQWDALAWATHPFAMEFGYFWGIHIIWGAYTVHWALRSKRYTAPCVMTWDGKWSINPDKGVHEAGEFLIFELGRYPNDEIPVEPEGTLFTPAITARPNNRSVYTPVATQRVKRSELPPVVRRKIDELELPEPFYLGIEVKEIAEVRPEHTAHIQQLLSANAYTDFIEQRAEDIMKQAGEFVETKSLIDKRAAGMSVLPRLNGGGRSADDDGDT